MLRVSPPSNGSVSSKSLSSSKELLKGSLAALAIIAMIADVAAVQAFQRGKQRCPRGIRSKALEKQ